MTVTEPQRKNGLALRLDRETIVMAALDQIAEAGLDKLTMRAIARRLACDPMAIYYYLPSKDDLLDAVAARLDSDGCDHQSTQDWQADIVRFANNQLAVACKYPEAIPIFTIRPSDNRATVSIREWLSDRLLAGGIHSKDAIKLMLAGINGILLNYYALRNRPDTDALAQRMMVQMVEGLCRQLKIEAENQTPGRETSPDQEYPAISD